MKHSTWLRRNRPIVRFIVLFVGLLLAFQIAYYEFLTPSSAFRSYLAFSTKTAALLLRLVGEPVRVSGDVMSSTFSMSVSRGCDGLQALAILALGVLAFPVEARKKIPGVGVGVALILVLNIVRIATLFSAGVHFPKQFQTLHVHVWPAVLIFAALAFWMLWAMWATRLPAAD